MIDHWLQKKAEGEASWASYWETLQSPYRTAIVDALRRLPAFESLIEIGCGPGVNLWRILEAFPDIDLTGFDVSPLAIEHGRQRFTEAMASGHFTGCGRVALSEPEEPHETSHLLALLNMDPADVVLTCYSIAYVSPRLFRLTMEGLVRCARQAVVLAEPMVVVGYASDTHYRVKAKPPQEFMYDYLGWFRENAAEWSVTMKPLHVQNMNRLLVAQRRTK